MWCDITITDNNDPSTCSDIKDWNITNGRVELVGNTLYLFDREEGSLTYTTVDGNYKDAIWGKDQDSMKIEDV